MPEGPSIVILKEAVQLFKKKKVLAVSGNAKIELERMKGQQVIDFKSWGKHFLICFNDFTVRIHLLMFGSYSINEKKDATARLTLQFRNGELNFYTCSVRILEGDINQWYDWSADVMNDHWNPSAARKKLKTMEETMVCDAMLDQQVFAGAGNIIKCEVLFQIRLHPENKIKNLSAKKIGEMIREIRNYSFEFYEWKKRFELRKHWKVYAKKTCPRCLIPLEKKYCGITNRRTFFCRNCQLMYTGK